MIWFKRWGHPLAFERQIMDAAADAIEAWLARECDQRPDLIFNVNLLRGGV